ncbi:MAG TPA: penicillin-binding protein 2, partial [Euzebya sp.]|nr:penicillin-binding protein 2 [Euzebya sp.]
LLVAYLLLVLIMGWRLVAVQLVDADIYASWAHQQTQREATLPAPRGALTDREGEPLAMSLAAATVFANPRVLAEADIDLYVLASQLSELLGSPIEPLVESLTSDRAFVYLGRQLPRAVGEAVTAMQLPGIGVIEEPTRIYPAERIASQVIGWAGLDNNGLAGIELQYDEALAGTDGTLLFETAPGGVEISAAPREVEPALPGVDVRLTIDREVQFTTEEILAAAVERYDALGGSAVVLDVETREILAMASVPSVAPDAFADADPYDRRNRAVTDVFEPGSINKVITIAGALEDGVVGPDHGFDVPSSITIGPDTFSDSDPHPTAWWSTRDIMARSSNVGTIRIAQQLGAQRLYDYVTDFGLGQPSGLSFPGESRGLLAPVEDWYSSSLPTIAIGQGVAATLLQTAQVFAVIAGGGEHLPASLVQGTVDAGGTFSPAPPREPRRVVSADTARIVSEMLVQVVESEVGTGSRAAVPGYRVGGKTGTAQKPLEGERGYAEDAYIATFVGFAPVEDPQVVVAVMLDEPTPYYGGLSAAPTFAEIMEFALRDQRVAPHVQAVPLPAGHQMGSSIARRPEGQGTALGSAMGSAGG